MKRLLYILLAICAIMMSCARMGSPDGGWYDDDPPRIIGSTPLDQSTNVTEKKITIFFDEFIKIDNATENVLVSPPQLEAPEIKAAGKKIIVELQDTLKPNTTYSIDFSDAITDNNEGNPLGNYAFTFSTGERIDTFQVAGYVLDASNLEPIKGISVGLYDNLSDSVFCKEPLMRIGRTDSRGHFVIKGVAPSEYRVYALEDADGNYHFTQKNERIAFSHQTYKPSAGPDVRQDTIWRDSLHIDNIIQVPYTHFYPDDVVMLAFQEPQTDRYLLKAPDRTDADRLVLYFSYGNEQLPIIRGLNFNSDNAFVTESSINKDTLTYWLRDTALINQDTLMMAMEYLITDSAGNLISQNDTIDVIAKTSYAKRLKALKKEHEEWQKQQDKRKKDGEQYDSIYPVKHLDLKISIPTNVTPTSHIHIESPTPLERLDTTGIHLYSKIDSLWYRAPFVFQRKDNLLRQYELLADWHPGTEYSFEIDSAAAGDIYGHVNDAITTGIMAKSLDEFATLIFQLSGIADTGIVVQLLDKSDKCVQQVKAGHDGEATFFYLTPGKYYARAFIDRNGNNQWDTGKYDIDRQPEDVYYYPHEIECEAKWDVTKQWHLTALKRFQQKPSAIIQQKADQEKKKLQNRNAERARQLGIEYTKKQIVK